MCSRSQKWFYKESLPVKVAVLDTEIFVRDSIESMTVAEKQLNVQREISTSDYPANRKSGSFSRESITDNGCLGCEVAMEL